MKILQTTTTVTLHLARVVVDPIIEPTATKRRRMSIRDFFAAANRRGAPQRDATVATTRESPDEKLFESSVSNVEARDAGETAGGARETDDSAEGEDDFESSKGRARPSAGLVTYTRRKKAKTRETLGKRRDAEGGLKLNGKKDPSDANAGAEKKSKTKTTQMCLDLGQASLRHVTCVKCGLVYAQGDPEDERTHAQYHEKFIASGGGGASMTLKPGAGQNVVNENDDVRCLCFERGKATQGHVERIARGIEKELSMPENWILNAASSTPKTFVCVSKKGNRIVGALFAEKVSKAFRTLADVKNTLSASEGTVVTHGGVEEQAACGVRAIWTHPSTRRKGYARMMLNAMRANMVLGYIVPVKECAFTQPTESGTALALSYCADETFLVY